MFYYYGAKARLAPKYPPPDHPIIVEPFAGAAGYSMHHLRDVSRVFLVEKDPRVVGAWKRLLSLSADEILNYPVPAPGHYTSDPIVMYSQASNAVSRCRSIKVSERSWGVMQGMLRRMASLVDEAREKVRIIPGNYTSAPPLEATWFIDPPYLGGAGSTKTAYPRGMGYAGGCSSADLDYTALGDWARARRGQVIVCEGAGADWLPFKSLVDQYDSQGKRGTEMVWLS